MFISSKYSKFITIKNEKISTFFPLVKKILVKKKNQNYKKKKKFQYKI